MLTCSCRHAPLYLSQPVNYLMFNFPSKLNSSLSSGFFVERPRQVLLLVVAIEESVQVMVYFLAMGIVSSWS